MTLTLWRLFLLLSFLVRRAVTSSICDGLINSIWKKEIKKTNNQLTLQERLKGVLVCSGSIFGFLGVIVTFKHVHALGCLSIHPILPLKKNNINKQHTNGGTNKGKWHVSVRTTMKKMGRVVLLGGWLGEQLHKNTKSMALKRDLKRWMVCMYIYIK